MTTSPGDWADLQAQLRKNAGLSLSALADKSGVARPNISAYENGRRYPTFGTAQKIAQAAGSALAVANPGPTYREVMSKFGRPFWVPDYLPSLSLAEALRHTTLPIHICWSGDSERVYDPINRSDRAAAYRAVITNGDPSEIGQYIDGALLIDIWDKIILPREILAEWEPLIRSVRADL